MAADIRKQIVYRGSDDPLTIHPQTEVAAIVDMAAALDGYAQSYIMPEVEPRRLQFINTLVPPALWVTDDTDPDYPLRAAVPLEGVEASGVPAVAFAPPEKNSGNYSQTATAYDGGVYLYAKTAPGSEISVPTIIVWR